MKEGHKFCYVQVSFGKQRAESELLKKKKKKKEERNKLALIVLIKVQGKHWVLPDPLPHTFIVGICLFRGFGGQWTKVYFKEGKMEKKVVKRACIRFKGANFV